METNCVGFTFFFRHTFSETKPLTWCDRRYKEVWKFRTLEVRNDLQMNLNLNLKPKQETVPINIISTSNADGHSLTGGDEFDDILSSFCENFDSGEMETLPTPYSTDSINRS